MTDTPRSVSEIARYRLAVERHLADLPAPIREDLLSDLEAHLTEINAELEPGVDLADRLGSPEAYARELRDTAEVPREGAGDRFRHSMWKMADPSFTWARGMADRFTASAGVGEAGEFGKALRPAWWVLRGLIAAAIMAHVFIFGDEALRSAVLSVGIFGFLFVVAVALVFVWLSLKLGVRSREWSRRSRRITAAGGIALMAAGVLSFSWVADGFVFYHQDSAPRYIETSGDPYEGVTDVYVYSEDGELLIGVYLFDQNGNPLHIGEPWACDDGRANNPFEQGEHESEAPDSFAPSAGAPLEDEIYGYRYPLCVFTEEQTEGDASDQATPDPTAEEPATEPTPEEPTTD